MDSGDQPTCSKYWREPERNPEPDPEPEPELPDAQDDDESDEPSPWQEKLPSTVIRDTADTLSLSEAKNLRLVCKNWTAALDKKYLSKCRRDTVNATHYKWEPIHYAHALYQPRLFPRMFHCGAHHPLTDKIYMFGGNGLQRVKDNYDFDAQYNDVWTYDMRLKQWDRLLVPGTPYPTTKSRSSMVAWREYLVLFGGFRRPNRRRNRLDQGAAEYPERVSVDDEDDFVFYDGPDRGALPHEVHYLNVKKNQWETATPIRRGEGGAPLQLGVHDHSAAVIGGKWMVVVGGLRSTPWEEAICINSAVFIFDLEEKVWHKAVMPQETIEEKLNAPLAPEFARGTLAAIRPGRLLFHPCFPIRYPRVNPQPAPVAALPPWGAQPAQVLPVQALMARQRDTLRAYFLDYDAADVLGGAWRWRPVQVASAHILRQTGPLAPPVVVRSDDRVKLVNAVIDVRRLRRDSDLDVYNGLQAFATTIRQEIRTRIADCTSEEFYESIGQAPFEFELDCKEFYKHVETRESGPDALKLIVSVLHGKSGHIGDYKVCVRPVNPYYAHVFTKGVTNFIDATTFASLPTKGGGRSPHAASTEKTLQLVRQSSRRIIKLLQADLTALDERDLSQLVWEETADRPTREECPVPSNGLLMVQADGTIFVTGGESKPDDNGVIDVSIGGGTWVASPVK